MSDPDRRLQEVLAQLGRQYLAEAPQRLAELRGTLEKVRTGDAAALVELRLLLHPLAGSGGSYGFDAVTERARAGELMAADLTQRGGAPAAADLARLEAAIAALAEAFRDAAAQAGR